MDSLVTLRTLLDYSDAMNRKLFAAAAHLSAAPLDQPMDMGPGSLRKTLAHIWIGESVWLERWKGFAETPWTPFDPGWLPGDMLEGLQTTWHNRDAFLDQIAGTPEKLEAMQPYRDSKGTVFQATLHEMILQGIVHSIHHRAQAVNMLRRVGGPAIEVDYMYATRRPTPQ